MKNLSKTISPIFFWSSMTIIVVLSIFLFSVNYKIVITDSAIASEPVHKPLTKTIIADDSITQDIIDCDCEKTFKKEYPIIWSGKVMATFLSGEDFGVERFNKDTKYNKFYVVGQNKYTGETGANVKVKGRLVGITCAYANTVFGECVGEVVADQVIILD